MRAHSSPLRVATLGFWHVHAEEYALRAQEHPDTQLVAVWDDDIERGSEASGTLGVEFATDLDALLARDDIDAVTVTTSTDLHRDVILKAASAGKHVFTEKVLAPTVADAEAIVAACDVNGVKLMVSLPRLYHGYTLAIQELLTSGRLGRIVQGRVHISHDGALKGWLPERFFEPPAVGGALIDLGCHPIYLIQLFMGLRPRRVTAAYGSVSKHALEDQAVVTATFEDGAIGVMETSFMSLNPFTVELFGTEGSVAYRHGSGALEVVGDSFDTKVWTPFPSRSDGDDAFAQWIGHIQRNTRADDNLLRAVELTRLIVAANSASAEGRSVHY